MSARVSFSTELLEQTADFLTAEGFEVRAAPLELLERGVVLTAFHPEKLDGYLIEPAELGMITRLGMAYLDPYAEGREEPRYIREDSKKRMKAYAEAVLAKRVAEVESAQPGIRNTALNSAAYTLGRYLGWEAYSEEEAARELLKAAIMAGLEPQEAEPTIRRALEQGASNPRDSSELEPQQAPLRTRQRNRMKGWK